MWKPGKEKMEETIHNWYILHVSWLNTCIQISAVTLGVWQALVKDKTGQRCCPSRMEDWASGLCVRTYPMLVSHCPLLPTSCLPEWALSGKWHCCVVRLRCRYSVEGHRHPRCCLNCCTKCLSHLVYIHWSYAKSWSLLRWIRCGFDSTWMLSLRTKKSLAANDWQESPLRVCSPWRVITL